MLNDFILKTVNLNKSFRAEKNFFSSKTSGIKAVDNVSIKLKNGDVMGIAGESGSGKTTLAKIVSGLLDYDSGEVFINDRELKNYSRYELSKKVQMIFQDPFSSLNPKLSIGTAITEAIKTQNQNLSEKAIEILNMVGMAPDTMQKYPHQFSGGQRQRIAIARALASKPEIIIADEPVSSLDISVQAQIMNLFLDLKKTLGLSYIIISHDLNLLSAVSDNIAIMQNGKIIEYGQSEKIMDSPENPYTQRLISSILTINV
ncbi:MAG: ABC transporter ATP-binding protein [Elusimicrobia bacterium CG06_land_8_20_14_3_00_38_11]|nr:MAG: ABC transporter ATP-binding protein [Elusimicrobia bacterium CG06_land_8_20_14_3_00_38_11]